MATVYTKHFQNMTQLMDTGFWLPNRYEDVSLTRAEKLAVVRPVVEVFYSMLYCQASFGD
jgi:hypothetical protein